MNIREHIGVHTHSFNRRDTSGSSTPTVSQGTTCPIDHARCIMTDIEVKYYPNISSNIPTATSEAIQHTAIRNPLHYHTHAKFTLGMVDNIVTDIPGKCPSSHTLCACVTGDFSNVIISSLSYAGSYASGWMEKVSVSLSIRKTGGIAHYHSLPSTDINLSTVSAKLRYGVIDCALEHTRCRSGTSSSHNVSKYSYLATKDSDQEYV